MYEYGSRPEPPYNYVCFVRAIAPVLPKDDLVFFYKGSTNWREDHEVIPLALFRNICHWKSRRPFENVLKNTAREVNTRWRNAMQELNRPKFDENAIKRALRELTVLCGVAVPTASALLTAWKPDQFGIIDFKTQRVLGTPERDSAKAYVAFRNRLLELKDMEPELKRCTLRQIELALWHYFAVQEADRRKRPGR